MWIPRFSHGEGCLFAEFRKICTMKRRILLWLCPILVLFFGVGLYAVWLFNQLGGSIDVILRENYQSVLAGQQMKESSERMDSGLSFALGGEEQRGRELFNGNAPVFQESLQKELNNITLPGEGELADKIRDAESRYQALARTFWERSDPDARRKMYFSELLPLFTEIKNNAQEVIRINQENMVQADHRDKSEHQFHPRHWAPAGVWCRLSNLARVRIAAGHS